MDTTFNIENEDKDVEKLDLREKVKDSKISHIQYPRIMW
jgi:hypothetical protein